MTEVIHITGRLNKSLARFRIRMRHSRSLKWSVSIFVLWIFIACFADLIANDKPLFAMREGHVMFPVAEALFSAKRTSFERVAWKEFDGIAVFPPVPYLPENLDGENAQSKSPFDTQQTSLFRRHWLGTDEIGRDVLAGMIHGSRTALLVGLSAMIIALIIGLALGAVAGFIGDKGFRISLIRLLVNAICVPLIVYFVFSIRFYFLREAISTSLLKFLIELIISLAFSAMAVLLLNLGIYPLTKIKKLNQKIPVPVDMFVMRLIEIMMSIPSLFLIIGIAAIAKPSLYLVMMVIGCTSWMGIARFVRAEMLRIRSGEYIESARALGYSSFRILIRHALPNAMSPVFVALAFGIAAAILTESSLSFIGIGVPAETVTWGSMIAASRSSGSWWLALFPGMAIFMTITCCNRIGEGLQTFHPDSKK